MGVASTAVVAVVVAGVLLVLMVCIKGADFGGGVLVGVRVHHIASRHGKNPCLHKEEDG